MKIGNELLRFVLSALASLLLVVAQGQTLKKVKEFKPGKIENITIDRLGDFFIMLKNGTITKYDANGKVLATVTLPQSPTLLEPWFHPRIMAYNQREQTYTLYDRNLENPISQKVDPAVAIRPMLACPTNDNQLLVLDQADWSIKKVNAATNQVMDEFYLDSTQFGRKPDIRLIREYQNLIFILDQNAGILFYNSVGKKINRIYPASANFGFFGEELYYLQPGKIVFFDLYTEKTRELKVPDARWALVSDERVMLVSDKGKVTLYEFSRDMLKD